MKQRNNSHTRDCTNNEVNVLTPVKNFRIEVRGNEVTYKWDNTVSNLEEINHAIYIDGTGLIIFLVDGTECEHKITLSGKLLELVFKVPLHVVSKMKDGSAVSEPSNTAVGVSVPTELVDEKENTLDTLMALVENLQTD